MQLDKELLDYLKARKLMALPTYYENPWICWVYYVVDDDLNLYFISSPNSQHGQDITHSPEVACAVADSDQEVNDQKKGVQLYGECFVVDGLERIKWFFAMWARINPGNADLLNFKNYKNKVLSSKVYKVEPKKVKFFNEEFSDGEESYKIFKLE